MYDNQLTGTLPSEWSTLTSLDYMFAFLSELKWHYTEGDLFRALYENMLSGTLPSEWQTFTKLTILYASNPAFSGEYFANNLFQVLGSESCEWKPSSQMVSNGISWVFVRSCYFGSLFQFSCLFSRNRHLFENQLTGALPPEWSSLKELASS